MAALKADEMQTARRDAPLEMRPQRPFASRAVTRQIRQWGGLGLCAAAQVYFLRHFPPARWQPSVDLAWLLAVVSWAVAFWRPDVPSAPRLRHPYWFYVLYLALLLPFGTNWRWTLAGDNLTWPMSGLYVAAHGPSQSLLSVNGSDNFGYLQTNLHNLFMFVISPTLFWHRAGKVVVGLLSVVSVFTVFARLVSPAFGLLVAACAASTSVYLVYTYASVPFVDGIASGYGLLAIGLWVRRDPASRRAWLCLGLLSGFMLFLTPNGWFMAICVWGWLTPQVFLRRWPVSLFLLAVGAGLITGLPMLIQWSQGSGGQLFSLVQNPGWTMEKVLRFLREAACIPFSSQIDNSGAFGPQLPWGFRWLFVLGIVVAPLLGRRMPAARFVLAFYLVHVVILAFSQGPYAGVSVKRALVLIPMAAYFSFILFHRYLRTYAIVVPLIAAWAAFGVHDVVAEIKPGRTGYTLLDGITEAHQRFADATICVFMRHDERPRAFAPGSDFDRLYHLAPRIQHVTSPTDPACRDVLCYCPQVETVDLAALGYDEMQMRNTVELRCGRRRVDTPRVPGSS